MLFTVRSLAPPRWTMFARLTRAAAARPPATPQARPHASTTEADHTIGTVASPATIRAGDSTSTVAPITRSVITASVARSGVRHRVARGYAQIDTPLQAAISASVATRAPGPATFGRSYRLAPTA